MVELEFRVVERDVEDMLQQLVLLHQCNGIKCGDGACGLVCGACQFGHFVPFSLGQPVLHGACDADILARNHCLPRQAGVSCDGQQCAHGNRCQTAGRGIFITFAARQEQGNGAHNGRCGEQCDRPYEEGGDFAAEPKVVAAEYHP